MANPQTIVTTIDNQFLASGGPCGLIFWNPATNFFKVFGIGFGFTAGDALNHNAPTLTGPAGSVFGAPTFQPGDVWVTINGSPPLYVNFKGSNNFRSYSVTESNGVKVDEATGRVYFTSVSSGTISRLDPATNAVTTWSVGGSPHYIAIDSSGRVYSAVATAAVAGGVDAIVRIDPSVTSGNVESWAIPGGGLLSGLSSATPDGVNFDSASHLWFTQAASTLVGRLNPVTGEISEFTTTGVSNPQLIASTGSGALLQSFFTEGSGNAVSIVTPTGAVPASDTFVTPSSTTVVPTTSTVGFGDFTRTPSSAMITPLVVNVTGVGGTGGIVRFPMPGAGFPSGMTGVVLPNTVFGSYLFNSAVFQVTSPVIVAPVPPAPSQTRVSKFFTDTSLNPLPLDSNGNPKVDVVLAGGVVRSTNPGEIIAWVNVTDTGGLSFQSLKLNETLPVDWVVSPKWLPAQGAIHVFLANTTSLATNPEITDPSTISVSTGNPETVTLAIPSLNSTAIGHPLLPGQSILLAIKLDYGLAGTSQSASSYPRNYTDTASAAAWTQPSFMGSEAIATTSGFFIAYAKVVGDVDGDLKVDITDLALVARSFGAARGSTNWNSAADLTNDGVIDIADLAIVARYFGS